MNFKDYMQEAYAEYSLSELNQRRIEKQVLDKIMTIESPNSNRWQKYLAVAAAFALVLLGSQYIFKAIDLDASSSFNEIVYTIKDSPDLMVATVLSYKTEEDLYLFYAEEKVNAMSYKEGRDFLEEIF